jgi:hypothetical protein
MDLRIVPQTGTLPGPITDLAGTTHDPVLAIQSTPAQRTRRFELQYRIVDLDPTDDILPEGLFGTTIDIAVASSGAAAGSTIRRAPLSQFEARLADSIPPRPIDTSGLPTSGGPYSGTHRPFRAFGTDNHPFNGTVVGLTLRLNPLSGFSPNQPSDGDPTAWYGLYSFEVEPGPTSEGTFTISPIIVGDPATGTRYGFWTGGSIHSPGGTLFSESGATLSVTAVPAPAGLLCCAATVCMQSRRRSSRFGQTEPAVGARRLTDA